MHKESKKHPILEILVHSEYDTLITEIHQSIRKWPICWLACEQLEYKFNGNKVHDALWFEPGSNSIDFFNSQTDTLLARISFNRQLVQLPESRFAHEAEVRL